jgi:enoyl-CoA hydratase/carnithine racemase
VQLNAHVARLAEETDTVGLVILRGAGRCFSAGHDLGDISSGEKLPEPNFQSKVIERLADLPQPVVTAVHSHCYTGALELALAGDIILASENAKFADTHAKWALTPVWGLSQRLPRRVGTYKARDMMFTCRTVAGREAEAIGLANICVADDAFEARIESLAREILANSWFSHRANKRLVRQTDGLPLRPAWRMRSSGARAADPTWKRASPASPTRASNRPDRDFSFPRGEGKSGHAAWRSR